MKIKFPVLFMISVLLTWMGSSNRQLILDRNPIVFWAIFLPCLAISAYVIITYFKDPLLQKVSGSGNNSPLGKVLLALMILAAAFAFTFAIQTPLDYWIIRQSKKNPEEKIACGITFFRSSTKPNKRFLKFEFREKKYRKFISLAEARKLDPGGDPYKGMIDLVVSAGPFGTQVIQSYEIRGK